MTTSVLERVNDPADVKTLAADMLPALAEECRAEIIRTIASNGGHLATNLGTVELSIALHRALSSPRDRIIWDVGNQCYTHKLLTGRRDRFRTIRQGGGLSGFVNRQESPHDHLTAGHAGTALSSALGIAAARDHLGDDYAVVAIVGDGAMTAGLSYEALNNLGTYQSQILVVLNDNQFSISRNSGALAGALNRSRHNILDGTLFEQLGITYLGPIDGHDLLLLTDVLHDTKRMNRPVLLHVLTQKGKGYKPAEADPARFHGVSPSSLSDNPAPPSSQPLSYSEIFGQELCHIAEEDDRVVAITAAMPAGTGLATFADQWPDRFFDVGIAEQHAVTFGAGLAAGGCRSVVAVYSTFMQRSYDQVVHDVCLQDLPVTLVLDRAGIVGADGPTHHGVFDFGFLRIVPGITIMAPKDGEEFKAMLRAAIAYDAPVAVRTPRGAAPPPIEEASSSIEMGRGQCLRRGEDIALIAIGSMVAPAFAAAQKLSDHGVSTTVINARFVKPLDESLLLEAAQGVKRVFTLEEHVGMGGFGSAVAELYADHDVQTPHTLLALPDRFIEHGSAAELLNDCGLSVDKVVQRVLRNLDAEAVAGSAPNVHFEPGQVKAVIDQIRSDALPEEFEPWVEEYASVGKRDAFLWRWCFRGVDLTTLSCVDPSLRPSNRVAKVLGVMLDVLIDDIADQTRETAFLDRLLGIPYAQPQLVFDDFSAQQQAYARTTRRVWEAITDRVRDYPRYDEFQELLRFDYLQLLNTMRYSHLVNHRLALLNLVEHDLYLPHNMHMMISGTIDLMSSPSFEEEDLGRLRDVLWHAQCMGRVGNLITTWKRELGESDLTSGVFARAVQLGAVTPAELLTADRDSVHARIESSDCEAFFHRRWQGYRDHVAKAAPAIRSVDVGQLLQGLERLFAIHMGSRGLK